MFLRGVVSSCSRYFVDCPIRWNIVVNWIIGIALSVFFLYILYSAWVVHLRIQHYRLLNRAEKEKKSQ